MIKIVAIGKIKEKYLRDAILEYEKRLSKYTKLKLLEGSDYSFGTPEINKKKEREYILKNIEEKDFVITMEIEGQQYSSEQFSDTIDQLTMNYPNLTFVIGGSDGLDEDVRKRSNLALSFSKMTFPHQLFRVLLLEQIYRVYKIINHETYHK